MREENIRNLGDEDVVLAAHPGSGTSWISSLLITLGICYVSGHLEVVLDRRRQRTGGWIEDRRPLLPDLSARGPGRGHARPLVPVAEQVGHNPILADRDRLNPFYREPLRVIQTHDTPRAFGSPIRLKVVLLVRDGRDAVLSLYHWLRSFTDLQVSLDGFLGGHSGAWPLPAVSWAYFNLSWIRAMPPERLQIIQFERCREDPPARIGEMLRFLGLTRSEREIRAAIEMSSYDSMRRLESRFLESRVPAAGRGRIMRRGEVGAWRRELTTDMLETFSGLPAQALQRFGYETPPVTASGGGPTSGAAR